MNMKTIQSLTLILAGAVLAVAPLCAKEPAKEPAKEMKCMKKDGGKKPEMRKMKQEMGAKMKAMEAKMKAEAAESEKLLEAMNSSVGDQKIEAIAAILNQAAQKEKAMKAMCKMMMKDGMKKKDGKLGELDYYTCPMHSEVHWPIPAKCPICAMDLVPVSKNP
jgi:rubrerythrin